MAELAVNAPGKLVLPVVSSIVAVLIKVENAPVYCLTKIGSLPSSAVDISTNPALVAVPPTKIRKKSLSATLAIRMFALAVPAKVTPNAFAPVDVIAPDDVYPVNVPTLVMFGCAAVVTVPAVVALVAAPDKAPTNVVAVIELFDRLAVKPVLVTSDTLPVAAFAKMRKLFPVPAATVIKSLTLA